MARKKWFVVVEREPHDDDPQEFEDVVIGPFKTKKGAVQHCQYSADVEDWCYGEAKDKNYIVDNVYVTDSPDIPSYGINAPILDSE